MNTPRPKASRWIVATSLGIPLIAFILLFFVRGKWVDPVAWGVLILLGLTSIAMGILSSGAQANPLIRGGAIILGAGAVGVGAVETLKVLGLHRVLPEPVWLIGMISLTAGSILLTAGIVRGRREL